MGQPLDDGAVALAESATSLVDTNSPDSVAETLLREDVTPTSTSVRGAAVAAWSRLAKVGLRDLQTRRQERAGQAPEARALALRCASDPVRAERGRAARIEVVSDWAANRDVVPSGGDAAGRARTDPIRPVGNPGRGLLGRTRPEVEPRSPADRRGDLGGGPARGLRDRGTKRRRKTRRRHQPRALPRALPTRPSLQPMLASRDDGHARLHANVIVVDPIDALVTSANLAIHARDLNMQMEVRVAGGPAAAMAAHVDRPIEEGRLEPYEAHS